MRPPPSLRCLTCAGLGTLAGLSRSGSLVAWTCWACGGSGRNDGHVPAQRPVTRPTLASAADGGLLAEREAVRGAT